jgi:hypothetical protein
MNRRLLFTRYTLYKMSKEIPQIIPSVPPEIEEVFAAHHQTKEFYYEVKVRAEFKRHCEWYYTTAKQNRQDLEKMRGELNILSWFRRRR